MLRILILHGPNLQALGTREPEFYGRVTLDEVNTRLGVLAGELGCEVETFQRAFSSTRCTRPAAAVTVWSSTRAA